DILLPDPEKSDFYLWSVIACDQFTGDPDYWTHVRQIVGDNPSTLHCILPEIYLEEPDAETRITAIQKTMQNYLDQDYFKIYPDAMVYTERTQSDGKLRAGVIGKIDLECYDYMPGSQSLVRATEATVLERIPPRMKIREHAVLELPHIMLLINDPENSVIGGCAEQKTRMQMLYDTDLMQDGGHITGYLMNPAQQEQFTQRLNQILKHNPDLQFAMGDGNHSLATAKACYEKLKQEHPEAAKNSPARYALVELVNLHSDALEFEAIHRILTGINPDLLIAELTEKLELSENPDSNQNSDQDLSMILLRNQEQKKLWIHHPKAKLAVGCLQPVLDDYLKKHSGKIDYIHGVETVRKLSAQSDSLGILLPDMDKNTLFPSIAQDGALPRKTFSMGHAQDKRYYMESRKMK
ncbi:MAG: DUF1015 domain-containing protein, partial [Oscillospiraceae bacterium]|nr:DUF1015 domain-containing protein [Oscillospiraceae bacterium]